MGRINLKYLSLHKAKQKGAKQHPARERKRDRVSEPEKEKGGYESKEMTRWEQSNDGEDSETENRRDRRKDRTEGDTETKTEIGRHRQLQMQNQKQV